MFLMQKLKAFLVLVAFILCFISCGGDKEDDDKNPTAGGDASIKVADIEGTYELVSWFDKDEALDKIIGSKVMGDYKVVLTVKSDGSFIWVDTETYEGKLITLTDSGKFTLDSTSPVLSLEILKSDENGKKTKNVGVKKTYAVKVELDKLILTQRSASDSFEDDNGDIFTFRKVG